MDKTSLGKSAEEYAAFVGDGDAVATHLHESAVAIASKAVAKELVEPMAKEITDLALRAYGMGKTAHQIETITDK